MHCSWVPALNPFDCDTISSHSPDENHPYILNIHSHKDCRDGKRAIFRNVTKTTSGWVSKNINSLISLPISKLISPLPITPNMITFLNTLVGIASAVFVAQGHTQGVLMGGILFQLSAAFDRVDGEIARSKFQSSKYGSWIDTAGDNITYIAFLIGLTVGCYKRFGNVNYLYAGFALIFIMLVMLAVMYRFLIRKGGSGSLVEVTTSVEKKMQGQNKPFIYRSLDKIRFAGKRDFFSLVCMFVCMADQLLILFGCALAVIIGNIAYFTSAMIKHRKNISLAQQS
ncbi:MAG: CDP-alcohol phosphatidyltransferase family protein [Bdellovibrionota bacterium]